MPDLRPLNFGEVLDGALTIYRRHFGLFVRISIVLMAVPLALLLYFVVRLPTGIMTRPLETILFLIPLGIVYYLASLVLTAATIRVISDSYLGRDPLFRDAIGLGMARIWPLFVVGLGKGLIIGLIMVAAGIAVAIAVAALKAVPIAAGFLAFGLVVAAIWFVIFVACGYGVTTQVVVLEELPSSFDAFGRSWELTRRAKLRVLGLGAVAFLLFNIVPSQVLSVIAEALKGVAPAAHVVGVALASAVPVVLAPVIACIFTLMYYDLRVRREAFDLEILSHQLGIA